MKHRAFRSLPTLILILAAVLFSAAFPARAAQPALSLTPEELAYVSAHPTVRVGYVQDRTPVSFSDKNGEFAGISRHIFDRIAELIGIGFEYAALPAGDVTYDTLLDGGFDLVTSVEYNKENQNARGILISEPYLSGLKVIVARAGLEFRSDAHLKVAISTGSQTIRKVLGRIYPNFELVDYPSTSACFNAVNSGEADLMIQNQYVAEYWFSKPVYEKLKVIPVLEMEDQLCFSAVVAFGGGDGPSEADGSVLIGILNKAIASLTEDEVGSFTIQGVMENQYRYTLGDFLYRYRFAFGVLVVSLFVILTLAIFLVHLRILFAENRADAKAKSQFLSTMSHEIRTPLNGLIGLNYLMSQKIDDKERMEDYLRQSTVTANYLLSLVNDILDMSKLEDQKMELTLRPIDLSLVLDTVGSIVRNTMSEKMLRFETDASLTWPFLLADQIRIEQVLLNLLDNARKFTPRGGKVDLTVTQEQIKDGRIRTAVTLSDTGRGMSEEFQKHLFEAFTQELETVSKGNQGTGLGLPISRHLARLMDGDLTLESKLGEGSVFTFTFLASPCDPPEKEEMKPAELWRDHARILVAEDNELNGEIILELLGGEGFAADLAENGRKALEMFRASAPYTYGLILMDLLMPEMDGFESAMAIRALDRADAKTVRIVACTANTLPEDRQRALESGMDDFLPKPVDVDELLRKIGAAREGP